LENALLINKNNIHRLQWLARSRVASSVTTLNATAVGGDTGVFPIRRIPFRRIAKQKSSLYIIRY